MSTNNFNEQDKNEDDRIVSIFCVLTFILIIPLDYANLEDMTSIT